MNFFETRLEKEDKTDPEIAKLIALNKDFKDELENLSRKEIKKKFAIITTGIRKHAKKIMKDLLEVAYKEMMKVALNESFHLLNDGFHNLLH